VGCTLGAEVSCTKMLLFFSVGARDGPGVGVSSSIRLTLGFSVESTLGLSDGP
jgi:hypothetical protein